MRQRFVLFLIVLVSFTLLTAALSGCSKRPKASAEVVQDPKPQETPESEQSTTPVTDATAWKSQVADVFFDYDKYALRQDSRNILQANAKFIKDNPGGSVTIEGHCDERGTSEYNLALGQRRADSVKEYLVNLGVSASRLQTISYGEERPFDAGHSESAWSQNRRAHFRIQ